MSLSKEFGTLAAAIGEHTLGIAAEDARRWAAAARELEAALEASRGEVVRLQGAYEAERKVAEMTSDTGFRASLENIDLRVEVARLTGALQRIEQGKNEVGDLATTWFLRSLALEALNPRAAPPGEPTK